MASLNSADVLKKVEADGVLLVDLQFTDYLGVLKSVTIPVHKLADSLEHGCWFDGSSVEGFARIQEADMYLVPDPNTYAVVPWRSTDGATARLLCDVYKADGTAFEGDPRGILKRVLKEADDMGFVFNTGPEFEFFMFPKTEDGDIEFESRGNGYYFTHAMDESYDIRKEITEAIELLGIEVEATHYEVADRQHEIDFKYTDALTSADSSISLKYVVKNIANLYRYHASFMPKPMAGMNGSGMHTHMSLADKKTGKNLMFDPSDKYNLSQTAYYFIGGLLKYVKEMSAIITPTVNSFKRLTPGFEAPVYICWARSNRSALIRVPAVREGSPNSTRFELRCPDPACNPYLAFAAMLKAGLAGIKEKIQPRDAVEEDVFDFDDAKLQEYYIDTLPENLGEAVSLLNGSKLMKDLLGEYTLERYVATKKAEWDSFRLAVTDWEIERYLQDM